MLDEGHDVVIGIAEEEPHLVGEAPVGAAPMTVLESATQARDRCLEPAGPRRLVAPREHSRGGVRRGELAREKLWPVYKRECAAAPAGEYVHVNARACKLAICTCDERVEPGVAQLRRALLVGGLLSLMRREVAGHVKQARWLDAHKCGRAMFDDGALESISIQRHVCSPKIVSHD